MKKPNLGQPWNQEALVQVVSVVLLHLVVNKFASCMNVKFGSIQIPFFYVLGVHSFINEKLEIQLQSNA